MMKVVYQYLILQKRLKLKLMFVADNQESELEISNFLYQKFDRLFSFSFINPVLLIKAFKIVTPILSSILIDNHAYYPVIFLNNVKELCTRQKCSVLTTV